MGGDVSEQVDPDTGEILPPEGFAEPCAKCRGKGIRWFGRGTPPVTCNTCKGSGQRVFKASAEARAHTRDVANARKARKLAESIAAFKAEYPDIWLWMETADLEFAGKMRDALLKWGGLTDRQLAASLKWARGRYPKRSLL